MVVEVKSVSDSRRRAFKRRVVRLGIVLFVITLAIGADSLARSYQYYSQIIDEAVKAQPKWYQLRRRKQFLAKRALTLPT